MYANVTVICETISIIIKINIVTFTTTNKFNFQQEKKINLHISVKK